MPNSPRHEGDRNVNDQVLVARTTRSGSDHKQHIWELRCGFCSYVYGAHGSDFHHRKCPNCQGGVPGFKIEDQAG